MCRATVDTAAGSKDVPLLIGAQQDHVQSQRRVGSVQLAKTVAPGDVIFVPGSGGLAEIGTAGGFMGHVMLVVQTPRRVGMDEEESEDFASVWPRNAKEIWLARTVEASREEGGMYESLLLLNCVPENQTLELIGEVNESAMELHGSTSKTVELWQSPAELCFKLQQKQWIVDEVLRDMRKNKTPWSWTTALRAIMRSAGDRHLLDHGGVDAKTLLQQMQECWESDPICTSVVISFWQRCLCKIAGVRLPNADVMKDLDEDEEMTQSGGESDGDEDDDSAESESSSDSETAHAGSDSEWQEDSVDEEESTPQVSTVGLESPAALVSRWMPMMSDSTLPGNMLSSMHARGWVRRRKLDEDPSGLAAVPGTRSVSLYHGQPPRKRSMASSPAAPRRSYGAIIYSL